ncbi:2,4-dienoyl-CoA reductase-like NADH-dependent reductase (Old Yellow Enzyme family) [Luteibacter sp. HA06]|jgi:NADPH2 dehydrogenase
MSALFNPLSLRGLTLANRIVVSPMCQYVARDGRADAWHLVHLGGLAQSGAGLLIIESTAVEAIGRITPGDLGLWDDATESALHAVLAAVRNVSSMPIALQLAHAGRKASSDVPWQGGGQLQAGHGGWAACAPSAVPQRPDEVPPVALDREGLRRVRDAFAMAARRAARLGLDALEIHGGHGYLFHQFLSPLANYREDEYGGSLENRMRFPLEIVDAVRAAFPDNRPVGVKLSVTDWVPGGWDTAQSVALTTALVEHGMDWVTASSGGVSPRQAIPVAPGYQVPMAATLRQVPGARIMAVGLITEPSQAEDIVAAGSADMVALARAMLYDPRWGWHAAAALGGTVSAAPSYWRALPHGVAGVFGQTLQGAR